MSLLYYMFQSILNTFVLGYCFGGKKNNYFHGWGVVVHKLSLCNVNVTAPWVHRLNTRKDTLSYI